MTDAFCMAVIAIVLLLTFGICDRPRITHRGTRPEGEAPSGRMQVKHVG